MNANIADSGGFSLVDIQFAGKVFISIFCKQAELSAYDNLLTNK